MVVQVLYFKNSTRLLCVCMRQLSAPTQSNRYYLFWEVDYIVFETHTGCASTVGNHMGTPTQTKMKETNDKKDWIFSRPG